MTPAIVDVTTDHLEEIPARVLTFLNGVGTTPIIRSILERHGYTQEEHDLGWTLALEGDEGFRQGGIALGDGGVETVAVEPCTTPNTPQPRLPHQLLRYLPLRPLRPQCPPSTSAIPTIPTIPPEPADSRGPP